MQESPPPSDRCRFIQSVLDRVLELKRATSTHEGSFAELLSPIGEGARESAINLVRYLAVRQQDIRPLQDDLSRLGLSSLGRMEANVQPTLGAVIHALQALLDRPSTDRNGAPSIAEFNRGDDLLLEHADLAFGKPTTKDGTRIMVTMPTAAATDLSLVKELIESGMTVARINCAHDGPETWARIIENVERASKESGRECRFAFDLAGPKLRTGPVEPSPRCAVGNRSETSTGGWNHAHAS